MWLACWKWLAKAMWSVCNRAILEPVVCHAKGIIWNHWVLWSLNSFPGLCSSSLLLIAKKHAFKLFPLPPNFVYLLIYFQVLTQGYAYWVLEREGGKRRARREREKLIGCFPYAFQLGIKPATYLMCADQGIKPANFWCKRWHSNQLSHLVRAIYFLMPGTLSTSPVSIQGSWQSLTKVTCLWNTSHCSV